MTFISTGGTARRLQKELPWKELCLGNQWGKKRGKTNGSGWSPQNISHDPPSHPGCPSPCPGRPLPSCPPSSLARLAAHPHSFPVQSCIQLVFVASATEIISTSSPSLAKLPRLYRRGWRRGSWELGCPQQGGPLLRILTSRAAIKKAVSLLAGFPPYCPVGGKGKAEGLRVLNGTLATFPLT